MIKLICKAAGLILVMASIAVSATAENFQIQAQAPTFSPIKDVEPVYPQRAIDRKISGFTLVEYKIGENGRAENVKIVDAEPKNVFDTATKRAITRTVYDKKDAASAVGDTFYRLYVYELDNTNANTLASSGY